MKGLFLLFILTTTLIFSDAPPLLKQDDIKKVMQQIMAQHVDKHTVTSQMLSNSFQNYFDQFDPARTYLLSSEVDAFVKPSKEEQLAILAQYKSGDFSIFNKLDKTIQQSIQRARKYRQEAFKNPDVIFQGSSDDKIKNFDPEAKRSFAKNLDELKGRISEEAMLFIAEERKRFGDSGVLPYKEKALKALDSQLVHSENQYLYVDSAGKPLNAPEKENLFTMHVLKSLARSLDSHTSYFSPSEAYDMKVRLEKGFEGIGVVLQMKPQGAMITKLVKGGPAEKSGKIKIDDQIIAIDGKSVENDSLEVLVDKLRGQNKTPVSLQIKRMKETFNIVLNREQIAMDDDRVDSSYEKYGDGIIGKITLHSFYQGENGVSSEKDVRNAIAELKKKGNLRGLILDMRENSGGFLTQAVKVAGLFTTSGVIVVAKYSSGEEKFYRDTDGKVIFKGPFVVLTSKATASAAEIVAQALQDYGVAIIVGDERTYGKGTIQSQTVTDEGNTSYFKVTVGKYYTVSGKTPQVRGVIADIVVPGQHDNEKIGEEYLEYPLGYDTVSPEYQDSLADVDNGLKPWYLHYYTPKLQKKETTWKEFLPLLKKSSEKRLSTNEEYQKFIKKQGKWAYYTDNDKSGEDPQMAEATQIIIDMIKLENKAHIAN